MTTRTDSSTLIYNRNAWDQQVAEGNMWTRPVGSDVIELARQGEWVAILISTRPTPRDWFPSDLTGVKILCLASGGGQQGPTLAATGAIVTVLDNSPAQLQQDRNVAEEHDLDLHTIQGDMADLSEFADESFDLVFHPVSNVFVPYVRPIWNEAYRVLRPGGRLLAGFMNPAVYVFDNEEFDRTGKRVVRYSIPYSDFRDLPAADLEAKQAQNQPMEFGHSLSDLIGGQLAVGFRLIGWDECERSDAEWHSPLKNYLAEYIATYSVKFS